MRFIVQGLFAMLVMFWLAVIIADTPDDAADTEEARFATVDAAAWLHEPLGLQYQDRP